MRVSFRPVLGLLVVGLLVASIPHAEAKGPKNQPAAKNQNRQQQAQQAMVQQFFNRFDADQDGQLNPQEFMTAFRAMQQIQARQMAQQMIMFQQRNRGQGNCQKRGGPQGQFAGQGQRPPGQGQRRR